MDPEQGTAKGKETLSGQHPAIPDRQNTHDPDPFQNVVVRYRQGTNPPADIDWKGSGRGLGASDDQDVVVIVPKAVEPFPLPHPAICILVRIDLRTLLKVPIIVNRQMLEGRGLCDDTKNIIVDFQHRHVITQEKLGQNISAGTFRCHVHDILIVQGWQDCRILWRNEEWGFPELARQGYSMEDVWPWVNEFRTTCLL
ncbi:hypothetical protein DL766_003703 [Monosporascus sp. MC13-8B]|uniref:Uncharacterized protein n=1 Tax=Monosporascus cannonballus TaxID=155416 RepID=A0ABY0GYP5_9PEZI|nr:hypothetical protein DL762_007609 [Monosporascus cannonballus]RYO82142.1 hypothetical protein DL763_008338 [Monosporascus cannonballus]RYP32979.1 hypothetical protein DL766_003703 [Monosporascus sp. MC13-8B]